MGLKIKGLEFIYKGTTRLIFDEEGKHPQVKFLIYIQN